MTAEEGGREEKFTPRQETFTTWVVLLGFAAFVTLAVIAFGMWVFN